MWPQHAPNDLARLRAQLATQQIQLAAQQERLAALASRLAGPPRPRRPRHIAPALLVALLVALVPTGILAVNPFADLDPARATGHNPNIDAIYNAGITIGCAPTEYCPKEAVTREQMASSLARTAGLGGNPPVVNAKTAQTADIATNATSAQTAVNATNAANAQTAANATNAANAQNAVMAQSANTATTATSATTAARLATDPAGATFAANGLVRVARGEGFPAPPPSVTLTSAFQTVAEVTITLPGPGLRPSHRVGDNNLRRFR